MPRIGVNLFDLDGAAQVHLEPAPGGPGIEEKVFLRLILVGRQRAIVQLLENAPVIISLAIDDLEFCFGGGICFGWEGHVLECEGPGGAFVLIMIDSNLYFGVAHGT